METDKRGSYPIELLKLALSKTKSAYIARPSDVSMSQYRTLKQLELGKGIDVVWAMTNADREKQLRPIRIPIDRGLIGWRLLAINKKDAAKFQAFSDVSLLRRLLTVQGVDWPDFSILEENGFTVVPSNFFDGMYEMLHFGRVHFFARSLTEIWLELESLQTSSRSFQVAPRWVLHYPAALYFFVRQDDDELANVIEKGLELSIKDGSMRSLFLSHFQDTIDKSDLTRRQVVELTNSSLPSQTPLTRTELWFNPEVGY